MTIDQGTAPATPAPSDYSADVQPANRAELGETPAEAWDRQNAEANAKLQQLANQVTQREWLLITRALDRTRNEIGADTGLTLLAMLWVRERHEHGGASWDRLLDLTDSQLEAEMGFPAGDRPEA